MNDIAPELLILVLLTALNAFFAGSEMAFVSLRESQLQRLEERSARGKRTAEFARNPNRFLSTVQIFITLAGFFSSATAAIALSEPVGDLLEPSFGRAGGTIAFVLVTIVIAYFNLVLGELTPKRIAMQRAESWALVATTPLRFLSAAARPAVWILEGSTNALVRLTGGDPNMAREEVTEEEIRDMLTTQDNFSPDQRSIITGAFEVAERTLREIVVPRGSVMSIPEDTPASEALTQLSQAGHSRAPVHNGDLDDVLGIVHVRDLVSNQDGLVKEHTRAATVLPESLGVLDALRRLQSVRQQMAIVVNEHGGVEGIITVEDLLEEIVGEIYDEFDNDSAEIERDEDGSVVLPGSFPVHDLPDLAIEEPEHEGNYATIAGFVLDKLGHIPVAGEVAQGDAWSVEVLEVEERAITKVKLTPHPQLADRDE